ncbi:MAG: helix-turn-helix domain-containing protein [Pseudomonas sp.]
MNTQQYAGGTPRERTAWIGVIEQGLAYYDQSLSNSLVASRLLAQSEGAESIDQASCTLLWAEAQALSGDALLGMACVRGAVLPVPLQMLELTGAASPDLGSAIGQLVRFFSLLSTQARLELHRSGDRIILLLRPRGRPHTQQQEALLGLVVRLLKRFVSGTEHAHTGLSLVSPEAGRVDYGRLSWCADSRHGNAYALLLPAAWMSLPLPGATPALVGGMTGALRGFVASMPGGDVVDRVRRDILVRLGSGQLTEQQIAEPLKVSPRHLRRLLRQHNTSYEQLLDQARREEAMRLLADTRKSLTAISYEVGFLDPSSFTRAFRRWTGISPSDYRRRLPQSQSASVDRQVEPPLLRLA